MNDFLAVLEQGAAELGLALSSRQMEQCQTYLRLLLEWNQKINLTAITEEREIAVKHFLDALAGGQYVPWPAKGRVLDLGSGAGFPGLVLKIWRPEYEFLLVDAVQKKVNFLDRVIEELGLKGIAAVHGRAEEMGRREEHRERYDLVVARAVAALPTLAEFCLPLVSVGGCFCAFKGPQVEEELAPGEEALRLLGGQVEVVHRYRLPVKGDGRSLVCVRKGSPTPASYPRRSGLPEKRPLGTKKLDRR